MSYLPVFMNPGKNQIQVSVPITGSYNQVVYKWTDSFGGNLPGPLTDSDIRPDGKIAKFGIMTVLDGIATVEYQGLWKK
jgi:hypothetical protein